MDNKEKLKEVEHTLYYRDRLYEEKEETEAIDWLIKTARQEVELEKEVLSLKTKNGGIKMSNLMYKEDLTDRQLYMVEQEYEEKKKKKGVMWTLWLLTSGLGIHRMWLGDWGYGMAMLLLNWLTLGIWMLVDAFFITKRLDLHNAEVERQVVRNVKMITSDK